VSYFKHIVETVKTIFEGMAITGSHFVRKPFTLQYPDRVDVRIQDTLPFRYRGLLDVDLEICTGCLACERACPIDCIVIDAEKDKNTKEMILKRFDIDRNAWTELKPMPAFRDHPLVTAYDADIYVTGGNRQGTTGDVKIRRYWNETSRPFFSPSTIPSVEQFMKCAVEKHWNTRKSCWYAIHDTAESCTGC